MSLLNGSLNVTRFQVLDLPKILDFENFEFKAIPPASEIRFTSGFLPLVPEANYYLGGLWAFRVRTERRRPDPGRVRALVEDKVRDARAAGEMVGSMRRRAFRAEAEEELLEETPGVLKDAECALLPNESVLVVDTTSAELLSDVLHLLRGLEIIVELKTPWGDLGEQELDNELGIRLNPGEAVNGCRFLKHLWPRDGLLLGFELVSGYARLQTPDMALTVSGDLKQEVVNALEAEEQRKVLVEFLQVRLWCRPTVNGVIEEPVSFKIKGASFQISGLRPPSSAMQEWHELLSLRLDWITAVYEVLDEAYRAQKTGTVKSQPPATVAAGPSEAARPRPIGSQAKPSTSTDPPERASPSREPPSGGEAA